MKDFFKYTLATIVGIFLFFVILTAFAAMSIVGMVTSGEAARNVDENSVMVLKLSGIMSEQSEENPLARFGGDALSTPGLQETLNAIRKAKDNEDIKGIYIEAGAFSTDFATMQELRDALADFRKSGKWIVAYGDVYTQGTYYISSVADKVYLNPQGQVDWHGLCSEPMFVKDLLAKFGIKMQVVKVGKYKSATEMFTEEKMSDANREQVQAYISGLWQNLCQAVAGSRKISVAQLNEYADNMITFDDQQTLIKKKMIDGLLYTEQVKEEIKKRLELEEDEIINQLSVSDMQGVKEAKKEGNEIAVYYAYGDIVSSPAEGSGLLGSKHLIVGNEVCRDLADLADDDDVKAVVIRVNSGGGSAYASEQMWHQIELLKKKKPVVISMGGMAASGGYYMSCNANWIVAEPTTLTGSIGIFGIIPDRSQLLTQKLGIKFDQVKTNRHSDMGTSARPMNEEEAAYLNSYITRGYSLFRKRVADGRKMTTAQVEELAQGHVFLGQDALKLKLVDELGGLDKAVAKAAKLAKTETYYTSNYPEQPDFLDRLLNSKAGGNYLDEQLRQTLGEYYEPFVLLRNINQTDAVQARLPFYLNIR